MALEEDLTQLIDINALGVSSINLAIEDRRNGSQQAYYYNPSVTSIPAMNIVCDTSNGTSNEIEPCTTFLYIRIPGNKRTVIRYERVLDWSVSLPSYAYTILSNIDIKIRGHRVSSSQQVPSTQSSKSLHGFSRGQQRTQVLGMMLTWICTRTSPRTLDIHRIRRNPSNHPIALLSELVPRLTQ